ncbi:MAG: sulfurtransferase-like selenium metabolism protein YedF [Candidatus Brocadiia bacterium]
METIDVRGLACPEPVIRTKKAIEENPNSVLTILIDDPAARENVTRMAASLGAQVQTEESESGEYTLTVSTGEPPQEPQTAPAVAESPADAGPARATVFVKSDTMGLGDDELGRVLMKAFLKTLKSAQPPPRQLIFVNHGVFLTTQGSEEIASLQALADMGVEIVSCGTCLDYFGKLDQVQVGMVGNMFDIVERLNGATKVIAP